MTTDRIRWILLTGVVLAAAGCGGGGTPASTAPASTAPANAAPASTPPASSPAANNTAAAGGACGTGQPPQTINVGLAYAMKGGVCLGTLGSTSQANVSLRRGWTIHWDITNDCGTTFDPTLACVEFGHTNGLLVGGHKQCAQVQGSSTFIQANLTCSKAAAGDDTAHPYSIKYGTKAGGDPEIDVICDTCDGR